MSARIARSQPTPRQETRSCGEIMPNHFFTRTLIFFGL
ncbi:MAG: hypothetical protein JWN51_2172, partial [Phycisphaerales bacterium]|nr:hypothetical protein [Phycisphaerales bacterium]